MPDVSNKAIGTAVVAARGSMSQMELGRRMRELGHGWSQATVWSVEKGSRPLRLNEATDLASVLNVQLATLAGLPDAKDSEALWNSGYDAAMRDVADFTKGRGATDE